MDKTKKKYIIISVSIVLVSIIALIGTTYALLTMTIEGDKEITLTAGILKVDFTEGDNINLDNTAPMTDAKGQKTTPYTFTVTNTGNINAYYHVSLEEDINNTLTNNYLKMRLTNDQGYDSGVVSVSSYGTGEFDIKSEETLEPSDKVTYQLWMWLDETADNSAQGKVYQSKIVVTSYDRKSPVNAVQLVKSKANEESLDYNSATEEQKKEVWTFSHPETEQTEALTDYRYIGADPNNYVTFNNETWRIIGVFSVDDGTGNVEERLKLIRNESIGNMAWDLNNINDWSNATLNANLNSGDYWTNILSDNAKSMIGDTLWYLGGASNYKGSTIGLTSHFYSYERGTTVYSGRDTSFVGKVGLMYPSDYGYATSGGSTTDRNTCLNKELSNWDSSDFSDCKNNDWIFNSSYQWTITPLASYSRNVFNVCSAGYLSDYGAGRTSYGVRPVVFLKSNIKIVDGDGSSSNPYILS